jgi:hypothetical protein
MKLVTYTDVHRSFITFSVEEYFSIEKQTIKLNRHILDITCDYYYYFYLEIYKTSIGHFTTFLRKTTT